MSCPICKGRGYNKEGIILAEKEVIPFFKKSLLKVKYPNHPFPPKYGSLLNSIFCYSQALAYNRAHNIIDPVYYTDNKLFLKFSDSLEKRFGMKAMHKKYLPENYNEACEMNVNVQ